MAVNKQFTGQFKQASYQDESDSQAESREITQDNGAHNGVHNSAQGQSRQTATGQKSTTGRSRAVSARHKKSASAFRTISEVAEELGVQQHVLRFWETKFTQVKPLKRGGGRRYYRPEDVALLQTIYDLLYTQGYTIKGAQKLLKGQGKQQIISSDLAPAEAKKTAGATGGNGEGAVTREDRTTQDQDAKVAEGIENNASLSNKQRSLLKAMLGDLKDLRNMIKSELEHKEQE